MFGYWEKRRERKDRVKELEEVERVRHKLLEEYKSKYNNALCEVEKIKVIEGNTSKEFEKKYNSIKKEFKKRESTMYSGDYDMIGELVNVRYSEPTCKNSVYLAIIKYTEYELEEGLSERDYNNVVNALIECDKKYYKLEKDINEIQ